MLRIYKEQAGEYIIKEQNVQCLEIHYFIDVGQKYCAMRITEGIINKIKENKTVFTQKFDFGDYCAQREETVA